jgi:hypothetical protein
MGGVKSRKREIFILTAVRISSPASHNVMYLLTNCVIKRYLYRGVTIDGVWTGKWIDHLHTLPRTTLYR